MSSPNYIDGILVRKCVGCGFCCIKARCSTSARIWPITTDDKGCPALKWDGSRYICKLAAMDGPKGVEYRSELYIDEGCCSGLNSWRNDVRPRRESDLELPKEIKYTLDKAFAAFLQSLSGVFMGSDAFFLACRGMAMRLESQGITPEEIEAITRETIYHYRENRSESEISFMG